MRSSRTSSVDLHLDVDLGRPRGRRIEVEQALRDAIRDGRLRPGAALPSTRGLAADLGVARGTVVEAYAQLVAEGYLVTRPGGATTVGTAPIVAAPRRPEDDAPPRPTVDLRPGVLDLSTTFPRRAWAASVRSVLRGAPDAAFDYGDPRGRPELREALAAYLARSRGVSTTPDRIVVCAGFAHGLSLVSGALQATGVRAVAMEDPCLPPHRDVVAGAGLRVVALPVDGDGARADVLPPLDVGATIVTPAHQYPMGVTLAPARRTALVAWARATGGVVIEDDYDGEFRYDRQPVGAVQGLDPDHVVYIGTTSKTIGPGTRVGWVVLPPRLVDAVTDAQRITGAWPPALEQLALAELLRTGRVDRHLRGLRVGYRKRRDLLLAALAERAPRVQPGGIAAGLHVLLSLADTTEDDVRAAAELAGIALGYLGPHHHDGRAPRPGVIVGYARQPMPSFPAAVDTLVTMLTSLRAG